MYNSVEKHNDSKKAAVYFDNVTNKLTVKSYGEVKRTVKSLAKAIIDKNLVNEEVIDGIKVKTFAFISKNQYIYAMLDFAVHVVGGTSVPLYNTFETDALQYIIENVRCKSVFVESNTEIVNRMVTLCNSLKEKNTIKFLIFEYISNEIKQLLDKINDKTIQFIEIKELLNIG